MKQLINGLIYDTYEAVKIISVNTGSNHSSKGFVFYKTKNGRLFKEYTYWYCIHDNNRLSETNENEMISILIQYNVSNEVIKQLFPNFKLLAA